MDHTYACGKRQAEHETVVGCGAWTGQDHSDHAWPKTLDHQGLGVPRPKATSDSDMPRRSLQRSSESRSVDKHGYLFDATSNTTIDNIRRPWLNAARRDPLEPEPPSHGGTMQRWLEEEIHRQPYHNIKATVNQRSQPYQNPGATVAQRQAFERTQGHKSTANAQNIDNSYTIAKDEFDF